MTQMFFVLYLAIAIIYFIVSFVLSFFYDGFINDLDDPIAEFIILFFKSVFWPMVLLRFLFEYREHRYLERRKIK